MTIPTRTLGKTGFSVSEIGFGAWAIGADWGNAVPEAQAEDALHAALEAGMTFIDTADIYGMGRSEKIIGRVLKSRSAQPKPILATKMGRFPGWSEDAAGVREAAQRSCENLGVEALDLVQLHCIPFDIVQRRTVLDSLDQAKADGLIKAYGLSVETVEEALWVINNTQAASLQVIFNLFRQKLITELLPAAQAANVGLIARVPLASGILSGKFKPGHRFEDSDHRHFNADGQCFNVGETFAGVPFDEGVGFAQEIAEILAQECPGATLAQKAMRWILDFPAISTVIPGAKTIEQSQANAAAALLPPLSPAAHAALTALYRERIHPRVRGKY